MRLWAALHENGWETWIAERGDGIYAAWACPAAQNAGRVYVEDTFEHASAAATFELARVTGHHGCGPGCSPWEPRESPLQAHQH